MYSIFITNFKVLTSLKDETNNSNSIIYFVLWTLIGTKTELPWVELSNEQQVKSYFESVNMQAAIYSGKEQVKYAGHIKNHPYLAGSEYAEGSLLFDGVFLPECMYASGSLPE